jgi:hypothetical protein
MDVDGVGQDQMNIVSFEKLDSLCRRASREDAIGSMELVAKRFQDIRFVIYNQQDEVFSNGRPLQLPGFKMCF